MWLTGGANGEEKGLGGQGCSVGGYVVGEGGEVEDYE